MIVIKELVRSGMLKINDFILACLVISGIVAIDLTIQFIFGKNLIGIEPIYLNTETVYFTGIFNKELIAGGFILMFSILGIFSLPLIFKNIKKIYLLLILTIVISFYFFYNFIIREQNANYYVFNFLNNDVYFCEKKTI